MKRKAPMPVAVLLSGSGRTLQNLIDQTAAGRLPIRIVRVISSRGDVLGPVRARRAGLETVVLPRRRYPSDDAYSAAVAAVLDRSPVELIALAGFMHLFRIPDAFRGRVMNIHPGLLPAFGGPGLYGGRVHRAVLSAGARESGCTVHFADNEYDRGPVILQRQVPVLPGDTAETLARRVFFEECRAYPEAIRLFAEGRLSIKDGKVEIASEDESE
jgi:formyltetrahydrofolate-dependent phosphoribosylglycinamide formyltransferase